MIYRILGAVVCGLAILVQAETVLAHGGLVADFNGDGIDDLAVGAPLADGGFGTVSIFFGERGIGFSTTTPDLTIRGMSYRCQVFPVAPERFGSALGAADFNDDHRSELVVGAPAYGGGRGCVLVLRLVTNGEFWFVSPEFDKFIQGANGMRDAADVDDRFGSAFATGDFDGNGYPDLAVGVPGQDLNGLRDAGAVHVLYAQRSGLSVDGNEVWSQLRSGVQGEPQIFDRFGFALAAGDFNGDRIDDLAVGVPFERGAFSNEGAVNVIYGTTGGLSPKNDQLLRPPAADQGLNLNAQYGYALAAGDVNGDGITDLAIGAPGWFELCGSIYVRYGRADGLFRSLSQAQTTDLPEPGDFFGLSLAVADFNGDGFADVAAGAPGEELAGLLEAGAVSVFYGAPGISLRGGQFWHQGSHGVRDKVEAGDRYGWALTAGDYTGDGIADLAIGVPLEEVNTITDEGATGVLLGLPIGLVYAVFYHPNAQDVLVAASRQTGAQFGAALTMSPRAQ
jgi:hypothetical protein